MKLTPENAATAFFLLIWLYVASRLIVAGIIRSLKDGKRKEEKENEKE